MIMKKRAKSVKSVLISNMKNMTDTVMKKIGIRKTFMGNVMSIVKNRANNMMNMKFKMKGCAAKSVISALLAIAIVVLAIVLFKAYIPAGHGMLYNIFIKPFTSFFSGWKVISFIIAIIIIVLGGLYFAHPKDCDCCKKK